jgi:hypothetical protein
MYLKLVFLKRLSYNILFPHIVGINIKIYLKISISIVFKKNYRSEKFDFIFLFHSTDLLLKRKKIVIITRKCHHAKELWY